MNGVIYLHPVSPARETIPKSVRSLVKNLCIEGDLRKLVVVKTWNRPGKYQDEVFIPENDECTEDFEGATIINYPDFDQVDSNLLSLQSTILSPILGACK